MGGFFKDNIMTLNEYITSNILSTQEKDTLSFRLYAFLSKVFAPSFAEELYDIFKEVEITEKNRKDDVIAMTYSIPKKKIVLNTHAFYALPTNEQMAFLAHELIHMAVNKGNTKAKLLNRALWKFYNKHKNTVADISSIMVGKPKVSKRWVNKNETFPYLMTEPIRWQYLEPGCKDELLEILEKSKLFKLSDPFWKKQLNLT